MRLALRTITLLSVLAAAALAKPTAAQPTPSPIPAAAPSAASAAEVVTVPAASAPDPQPVAAAAPPAEKCNGCHGQLTQRAVVHGAMRKHDCRSCHRPEPAVQGKCRAKSASKWALVRAEPELCYGCHARKDESKSVHTAVRQGSCLSCHTPHASAYKGLLSSPREKVCFDCHDADAVTTKPVKHAPAMEGQCLSCHDAHGGDLPNAIKAESGNAFCLKCHDAKAPTGKGTPGPGYRVDLTKASVHAAIEQADCSGCHDAGHAARLPKLLRKAPVDLCYDCHERKDKTKYPHGAVLVGDCAVCHDPHSSANKKLVVKASTKETCFVCHQDDLTGRKVLHAPVEEGCDGCHDPHGSANRFALTVGEGEAACYSCHEPFKDRPVRHAPLDRYGCTGCHDPHGTGHAGLVATKINALCSSCHPAQADGRHVTPIVAAGHPVDGERKDPRREGRTFSCASCHDPHGSKNPKLFRHGKDAMESCAYCHGDKTGKDPTLKDVVSTSRQQPQKVGAAPPPPGPRVRTGAGGGGDTKE